jgi:hypothetical protein
MLHAHKIETALIEPWMDYKRNRYNSKLDSRFFKVKACDLKYPDWRSTLIAFKE